MEMKNYQRGYMLEWKTKQALEKKGWMVIRSPASKSPFDLLALKKSRKMLVQCKKTSKDVLYIYELGEIIKTAEEQEAEPVLTYAFNRTPIYAKRITQAKENLSKEAENTTLEEYLGAEEEN